ncbi:MAG TPA: COQ9 family protein [Caulobacteraceae bacterium]|jgi:ubiquinone biosynthesis protein COQ9|nr:COQ9 family protein [Caulobacteraceae bacterium]
MNSKDGWAERTEQKVLDAAIERAPRTGWTYTLLDRAAKDCGLSRGDAELLFPNGVKDLAALLSRRHDDRAFAALAEVNPKSLKIRERIARGIEARLDAAARDEAATRRWAGFLALPMNAPLGLRLAWESADRIWRWAGDEATDENHYSKRAILSGILIPALGIRLREGDEAAKAFVAARIENVMAFEKWKAGVKPMQKAREIAQALGRMRYGANEPPPAPPET